MILELVAVFNIYPSSALTTCVFKGILIFIQTVVRFRFIFHWNHCAAKSSQKQKQNLKAEWIWKQGLLALVTMARGVVLFPFSIVGFICFSAKAWELNRSSQSRRNPAPNQQFMSNLVAIFHSSHEFIGKYYASLDEHGCTAIGSIGIYPFASVLGPRCSLILCRNCFAAEANKLLCFSVAFEFCLAELVSDPQLLAYDDVGELEYFLSRGTAALRWTKCDMAIPKLLKDTFTKRGSV